MIENVVKRSGAIVPFNPERITNAIYRAAVAVGGRDRTIAERLTGQVDPAPGRASFSGSYPDSGGDPGCCRKSTD